MPLFPKWLCTVWPTQCCPIARTRDEHPTLHPLGAYPPPPPPCLSCGGASGAVFMTMN